MLDHNRYASANPSGAMPLLHDRLLKHLRSYSANCSHIFYVTGKLSHDDKSGNADQDAGFATVTEYSVGKKPSTRGLF